MEWISVSKLPEESMMVLVWQNNLSDPESSRFQRALYLGNGIFIVYPRTENAYFKKDLDYKERDLEGDMCQLTHWAVINPPKQ